VHLSLRNGAPKEVEPATERGPAGKRSAQNAEYSLR
jgi:hypothetical protein